MMTMFKFSAAAALLLATAAPALAAGSVLTVDLTRVLGESAAGKSGTTQLTAKYDAQLKQRQAAFNTAAQSYQTQLAAARAAAKPGVQPPAATLTAVNQAGERAQAAQNSLNELGQEIQAVQGFVRQQIIERSGPVAEQVRAEHKADLVVPKGSVLASDPTGDVTTVVIQRLDVAFPNPSITLPNQAAPPAADASR